MKARIWFITGISSGLGAALAQTVLAKGDFVAGTFRQPGQAQAFTEAAEGKGLGLMLDLTKEEQIDAAVALVEETFGRIDVLVNNAGYGLAGAVEETGTEEARGLFEANFFGPLRLTQKALPLMRKQGGGRIIQISSHGGFKAFPGFGLYNASKFALEGFSEALAQEAAPLGIKVTIVQPGPFRTRFAAAGFGLAAAQLPDYEGTAGLFRQRIKGVDGKQEGDPKKAAEAIWHISELDAPPLRLPLGKIALASLSSKIESVVADMDEYRQIASSVVFDA